jgi:hypothetical protein
MVKIFKLAAEAIRGSLARKKAGRNLTVFGMTSSWFLTRAREIHGRGS